MTQRKPNCRVLSPGALLVHVIVMCLCAIELTGQTGNLTEISRFNGIWGYAGFSNVRATQHGVAIALTVHHADSANGLQFKPSSVLAITDRGLDTIELGSRTCVQAAIWKDTVFSAIRLSGDTVFVATSLSDLGERSYVEGNLKRLGTNINCIDGSLCIYDAKQLVATWKNQWASPRYPRRVDEYGLLEMFSIQGDVFVLGSFRPHYFPFESESRIYISSSGVIPSTSNVRYNVSVVDDSVVWVDNNGVRWSISISSREIQATPYEIGTESFYGGCAGRYGYITVSEYQSNPFNDEESTNSFNVSYSDRNGKNMFDTVQISNIRRSGMGVGWWNGSFYFTVEVRDSGAPYETAESIIYKYTEPIPVVSVEDQLPNSEKADLAERLAFTQDAYASWRDGLGANVTAYDLLGNEVRGFVVPLPGVYCVRGQGKVWLVSVTP